MDIARNDGSVWRACDCVCVLLEEIPEDEHGYRARGEKRCTMEFRKPGNEVVASPGSTADDYEICRYIKRVTG